MGELATYFEKIKSPSSERLSLALRVLRRDILGMNGTEFGDIIGVDQARLSRLETGQVPIPPRDSMLGWCEGLAQYGAEEDDLHELMMSAGHLPKFPVGFGGEGDAWLLQQVINERMGRIPEQGFMELCKARITLLRPEGVSNIYLLGANESSHSPILL